MVSYNNNFFQDFLEQEPTAAFFSAIKPFGTSPRRSRFLQEQYAPNRGRYMGELGEQLRQGILPDLPFTDFLSSQDFNRQYMDQPRYNRGMSSSSFNPRTRFLYGF